MIGSLGWTLGTRRSLPIWPGNPQWKADGNCDELVGGKSHFRAVDNELIHVLLKNVRRKKGPAQKNRRPLHGFRPEIQ